MLLIVCGVIVVTALAVVLAPFWMGQGGVLQDAAGESSIPRLEAMRGAVLKRWLEEEKAAAEGLITKREWEMRQVYLTNRYVDATRRLDWVSRVGETT